MAPEEEVLTMNVENSKPKEVTTRKSFASIAKSTLTPKKDQGIVFTAIEKTSILKYIVGVGELIGPGNIIFSSKISNNRIVLFLSNKQHVLDFLQVHKGITVDGNFIPARPLIVQSKRIVISNVPPYLPSILIENKLKEIGIKLYSAVNYLRAGIKIPGYEHILSSRRHTFAQPDTLPTLPANFLVEFEGDTYRLFLDGDEVRCFSCHEEGHISKNCPLSEVKNPDEANNLAVLPSAVNSLVEAHEELMEDRGENTSFTTNDNNTNISQHLDFTILSKDGPVANPCPAKSEDSQHSATIQNTQQSNTKNKTNLRTVITEHMSATPTEIPFSITSLKTGKLKNKQTESIKQEKILNKSSKITKTLVPMAKRKNNNQTMKEMLEPIRILVTNDHKYPLAYSKLCLFLEMAHNEKASNIKQLATQFTKNIDGLKTMLTDVRHKLPNRGMKIRVSKIIKELSGTVSSPNTELFSDSDDSTLSSVDLQAKK